MGALGLGDDTGALVGDASGLVETYRHRIASWETIRQGEPPAGLPIGTVAEVLQVPVAAVLTWLRAGCPYVEAGCWQTGEGFMVSLVWTVEWRAMLAGLLAGDAATARELRLS